MIAGACGGGAEVETAHEGTYAIVTHTVDTGCDGDEESVIDQFSHGLLEVHNESIFGVDFVQVDSCETAEQCAALRDPENLGAVEISESFEEGSDSGGFSGQAIVAGTSFEGDCVGERIEQFMDIDAELLRITLERTAEAPFAEDDDGFCTTDNALEATEGLGCAERTVIEAQR